MDITQLEKNTLKEMIVLILKEDKELLKEIIREVLIEEDPNQRASKIEKMIDEDFEKYNEVFKALA